MNWKFYNILARANLVRVYHLTKAVQAEIGIHWVVSIVLLGALTRCALLHSVFDLKATQMNVQHSLIQKLILHGFKLGYNAWKQPKILVERKVKAEVIPLQ